MSGAVLYISYDGMLEPLGQSQVLAYLERLAGGGPIHLISFEKPEDWARGEERAAVVRRMAAAGIAWRPLRYHKRPSALATAYDIACGIVVGTYLAFRHRVAIVHARSYVASVMALAIKRLTGARYLFDMRGFWADERVEGGIWPAGGRLYKLAKGFERRFLLRADAVVSLTHAAVAELAAYPYLRGRMPPTRVIPTCADLDRFRPPQEGPARPFTLGYVGTVGNWYDFQRSAALFKQLAALRPGARFLVVNRGEHELIHRTLAAAGVETDSYSVRAADFEDVPGLMGQMSAGILIARPAYSHIARAPTKLAEFLGCGVPCLVGGGVGDVDPLIAGNRVGVVLEHAPNDQRAVETLAALAEDPAVRARCVETAAREFSLEFGVAAYDEIYRDLGA